MNQTITPEINEVIHAVHYRPAVSIIMPFEPKMGLKAELTDQLKRAIDKVEKEIRKNYPDDLGALVIRKLRTIVKELNFNTFKKSIAIYVSPVFEKVLYLDIPVEEKIIVDESFEIRDLVYAKKEIHKYLVMVLSSESCNVFIGNTNTFIKVKSNVANHVAAVINDAPEKVANFSDAADRNETTVRKFLHACDEGLSFLLKTYRLPVFLTGTVKTLGHFNEISKNKKSIVGYIHGNFERATEEELRNILKPYVNDWKKIMMQDLLNEMSKAADAGKLSNGIKNVWEQASQHKARLLIVEKNFMYAAEKENKDNLIYEAIEPFNKFSYIKDAVDDVIEKVLESGGDVEFVDEGILKDHQHIALIRYY